MTKILVSNGGRNLTVPTHTLRRVGRTAEFRPARSGEVDRTCTSSKAPTSHEPLRWQFTVAVLSLFYGTVSSPRGTSRWSLPSSAVCQERSSRRWLQSQTLADHRAAAL